ncbi:prolyl oligopeptidase family serine peptidase [Halorussus gelatinilyticus]|uniref:Prolyl oligopeptidase family serine peptidase n=1 Tax=Halorussus gelatinilyticus TaxID=2937524 RepID=A0A8U0IEL1_9EURY|nr:prolyl oligopeptidase family serine peptidase [Halorussus gelatinilyticus]UPV99509.1 prolyl oligopeptidase family serine peptidase [Halorussus gelatinilyticus]
MSTPPNSPPDPPATRRDETVEEFHETEISDPYRWLEADDATVREWTAAQNEYADAILDSPTRERLRSRMDGLADVPEYGTVEAANGRYFRTVRESGDDRARLLVGESPGDDEAVLADPDDWADVEADDRTGARSMSWFLPSPDGDRVAYGVAGGDERVDIRVVSVPDGEEIAVRRDCGRVSRAFVGYDPTSPGTVAWDADGEGLFYVGTEPASDGDIDTELRHWRFGGRDSDGRDELDAREEVLLAPDDRAGWPLVRTDPESGTLAVAFHDASGTDWAVRGDGAFRPVLGTDAETFAVFRGDTVFVQTDHEAPRKRLLACSLAQFRAGDLALSECETILPEREAVLQSVAATPDHLVARYSADARARLAVYDHDGGHVRDLPVPENASVSRLRTDPETETAFYLVEGFDRAPTLVRADLRSGDRRELARVEAGVDGGSIPDELVVRQIFAESSDGVEVPVFVCHREGIERDGDNPTILHGYGGFRSSRPPSFGRFRLPFLADGGVYAQVCARGGHEYGEAWHEAATGATKQRTFDDFVAAGEYLRSAGYTNSDRLAVTGRSNGGLSVGAVVTQRPDHWAAAVCSVPLLDMLRYHRFGMGASWTAEYGDPDDESAFESLRAYSPYHNVESGVEYPAVLFTTGAEDTRVHPGHARKMTARMQAEGEGGPFVLRTTSDAGHGGGASAETVVAEQTDRWTFLYEQLGMDGKTNE